ncbi:hypothetical protein ACHQM5_021466 [Ranunculus cassubicifolius]
MADPGPLPCVIFIIALSFFTSVLANQEVFIIHMDVSAMPKSFTDHHNWYVTTLAYLSTSTSTTSSSLKPLYTYYHAIHGFSAKLSALELKSLEDQPGFISAIRDVQVTLDTTHTPRFLQLNSNYGAWPASNYRRDVIIGLVDTGIWPESQSFRDAGMPEVPSRWKDVIIGLVDTGIWPESQSFRDAGMPEVPSRWKGECEAGTSFSPTLCNRKLIGSRYFNKGLLANVPNVTIVENSTRDTEGHGTHTASTAAGSFVEGMPSYFGYATGIASGIAPQSRVAMYKALWGQLSYTSDVLAAIDKAIDDGVDVLSLSFGSDRVPLYDDPIAIATFSAMEKGIFVAASAGNGGPWPGVLQNAIPWLVTVAAASFDRKFNAIVILGQREHTVVGESLYPGNTSTQGVPLVFVNNCINAEDIQKVGYKIVVCCSLSRIFISNSPSVVHCMRFPFPSVFLSLEDGQIVLDYIKSTSYPRAGMEFTKTTHIGTAPAPPDLMGPGTFVLASWTQTIPAAYLGSDQLFSKFNLQTGTSMSCPHVAGIAALLKCAHPEWSPTAIRSAMMTTSDVLDNTGNPIKDSGDSYRDASPLAMGAGHINPNKALEPGLVYDASTDDYVSLLCSLNYTMKQIQHISRTSSFKCLWVMVYRPIQKDDVAHGSLTWVDTGRKYVVRSPIVATKLNWIPLTK